MAEHATTIGSTNRTRAAPQDRVDTPRLAYTRMKDRYWQTIEALRGGTQAMRDAGETFLPKRPRERQRQWDRRRRSSFLDPFYDEAVSAAAARPFVKPVTVRPELPEPLAGMVDDIDRAGRSLTVFAHEVLDTALDYGMTHILVDAPRQSALDARAEQDRGIRPYFVHVEPRNLIGADTIRLPNGRLFLARIRIREVETVRVGDYGEAEREKIRVYTSPLFDRESEESFAAFFGFLNGQINYQAFIDRGGIPGSVVTFSLKSDGEWEPVAAGDLTFPGIPLVTLYTNRTGWLEAQPFFWRVADVNVQHWQAASVHTNYVQFAQSPAWKMTGVNDQQWRKIDWGVDRVIPLPPGADFAAVEVSGKSYDVGKDHLAGLRDRGQALSLEPYLTKRPGTPTATSESIRESKNQSQIQRVVRALEHALWSGCRMAETWYMAGNRRPATALLPPDFTVDVFSDISAGMGSSDELTALGDDFDRRVISVETYLGERKRRGLYSETLDVEEEARKVAQDVMEQVSDLARD